MIKLSHTLLISAAAIMLTACSSKKLGPLEKPMTPEMIANFYDRTLVQWDHNQDNTLTCDDVKTARTGLFQELDTNGNKSLGQTEYRRAQFEDKSFMFFRFDQLDSNADGIVSIAEFNSVSDSNFRAMDKNEDCNVSALEAAEFMRAKRFHSGSRPNGKPGDSSPRRRPDEGGVDPF